MKTSRLTEQTLKGLFLGSKTLGLGILRCLVENDRTACWRIIHPLDVDDTRSAVDAFIDYARKHRIEMLVAASAASTKAMIRDFTPDIVFVCGWYSLLDDETLSYSRMGFYGIHTSILPRYRGGSPLVWSIINGDTEVGATVFRFASGMDNGDVLYQIRVFNSCEDNIGTLLNKIELSLVTTLPDKWRSLLNGSAKLITQDDKQATYCGQRIPEDGKINWHHSAEYVHNFIRAQTPPYPGAFSHLDGTKIIFLRSAIDDRVFLGTSGQVLRRSRDSVLVSCGGHSALKILDVAIDGVPTSPFKALSSVSVRLG